MQYKALILLFVCTVCCTTQQNATTPIASQIRLVNGLQTVNVTLTVYDGDIPRSSSGYLGGYSQYIYSGEQAYYYEVSLAGSNSTLFSGDFVLVPGKIYTYALTSLSNGLLLEDAPPSYSVASSYIRVLNCCK